MVKSVKSKNKKQDTRAADMEEDSLRDSGCCFNNIRGNIKHDIKHNILSPLNPPNLFSESMDSIFIMCVHRWHFVKFESKWPSSRLAGSKAIFVCDKCGACKEVECKEPI